MTLKQRWTLDKTKGYEVFNQGNTKTLIIKMGKAYHIGPKEWKQIHLPFSASFEGGVTIANALQKRKIMSQAVVTKAGHLRLDVYNPLNEVVYFTPNTGAIHIFGVEDVQIFPIYMEESFTLKEESDNALDRDEEAIDEACLRQHLSTKYPILGDLSEHPITPPMAKLEVKKKEINCQEPNSPGLRTSYQVEKVADRRKIEEQIGKYVQRGYIEEVGWEKDLFMNPLLPLAKKDGSYRFVNDYRWLNKFFSSEGTIQKDVWRSMWEVNPLWKYFTKIDLKDGFFAIPVEPELRKYFGFSWGTKRYRWCRVPQGWKWSPIVFWERVSQILKGLPIVQYADDILVGSKTKKELLRTLDIIFQRLQTYGLKVNYDKVEWLTTEVNFLGHQLTEDQWSLKKYLNDKLSEVGGISGVKKLQRILGIFTYVRRSVPHLEDIISPLREALKEAQKEKKSEEWWENTKEIAKEIFRKVLKAQQDLALPGQGPSAFRVEVDWSGEFAGFLLFAVIGEKEELIEIGSSKIKEKTSSYLGEMKSIVWALKRTKALRGDIKTVIINDNEAVCKRLKEQPLITDDKRTFRLWGWFVANEPNAQVEYRPGVLNEGADYLSRPQRVSNITNDEDNKEEDWINLHFGHVGLKTMIYRGKKWGINMTPKEMKERQSKCDVCAKFRPLKRNTPLGTMNISEKPGQQIGMDFIGPVHETYCLVTIDFFSRLIKLKVSESPNAEVVLQTLQEWQEENGPFEHLITDGGSHFANYDVAEWCVENTVQHKFTLPYDHRTNGLTERAIRSVNNIIRKLKADNRDRDWWEVLGDVEWCLNHSYHHDINQMPTEAWTTRPEEWKKIKERRVKLQAQRNKNRRGEIGNFEKFDRVWLYKWGEKDTNRLGKFESRWEGPCWIMDKVSDTIFKVRRVKGTDVFVHSDYLRSIRR